MGKRGPKNRGYRVIQVYLPGQIAEHFEKVSAETLAPVSALLRRFIVEHFEQEASINESGHQPTKD